METQHNKETLLAFAAIQYAFTLRGLTPDLDEAYIREELVEYGVDIEALRPIIEIWPIPDK